MPCFIDKRKQRAGTCGPGRGRLHHLLIFLCLCPLLGCEPKNTEYPGTIIVSGDTAGWIVPCGCASNQSGGLPRRATFIEQRKRQGPVAAIDVGGAGSGTTLYDKLKFEAILQGEAAMGVIAHNIGRAEAAFGVDEIRNFHDKYETPWISANTTDAEGNSLAEPVRIVEIGKRKILFVGVLSQDYATESIRVTPPRQAVLKSVKDNAGRYDYAVVLAYVPEDELRELAESLPEVDAVVGGPTGQPVPPQGAVLTTSATKQGKFLAMLTLPDKKPGRLRGEIVELDERFEDDPKQTENVRKFYSMLKERDLAPVDTPFVDRDRVSNSLGVVSGTKSCADCHEDEYRTWKNSRHAAAWQSLVGRNAQYDPDCQRCHVTGYGLAGGFETAGRSADRVDVGCESCHGPSSEHCGKTSLRTSFGTRRKDRCVICHDKENSPAFEYDEYWTKIKHGTDDNE